MFQTFEFRETVKDHGIHTIQLAIIMFKRKRICFYQPNFGHVLIIITINSKAQPTTSLAQYMRRYLTKLLEFRFHRLECITYSVGKQTKYLSIFKQTISDSTISSYLTFAARNLKF